MRASPDSPTLFCRAFQKFSANRGISILRSGFAGLAPRNAHVVILVTILVQDFDKVAPACLEPDRFGDGFWLEGLPVSWVLPAYQSRNFGEVSRTLIEAQ